MSWGELLLYNESVRILVLATLLGVIAASQSLFDYDRTLPFDFQSEPLSTRKDVRVSGASIQIIKAHRMDFVLVEPVERTGTARSPLVIYQHGGGQSMSNYVAEAALLSKAGVVSMIIEAPFRREPKADPNSMPTGAALRDDSANVVIAIRRSLDWLETRPNVDRQRVAYVGSVGNIVHQLVGGLQQSMGYCGAPTIEALKQAEFIRMTAAGLREAHPHDITITEQAPNYRKF